jgi:hypothetical protein
MIRPMARCALIYVEITVPVSPRVATDPLARYFCNRSTNLSTCELKPVNLLLDTPLLGWQRNAVYWWPLKGRLVATRGRDRKFNLADQRIAREELRRGCADAIRPGIPTCETP